ncbi:MAG: hypothetical protein JXO22_10165 [Phycisphaerae bacterium]|nr:hypothetical protein [Phycisphaerae bacterium]
MLHKLRERFISNMVVLLRPAGLAEPPIARIAWFTRQQRAIDGVATAYVCTDHACRAPTTDAEQMLRLLSDR